MRRLDYPECFIPIRKIVEIITSKIDNNFPVFYNIYLSYVVFIYLNNIIAGENIYLQIKITICKFEIVICRLLTKLSPSTNITLFAPQSLHDNNICIYHIIQQC